MDYNQTISDKRYFTGRRMIPGSYHFNKETGRMEFFITYFTDERGIEYKIFLNRGEFEVILHQVGRDYGRMPIYAKVLKRLLPESVKKNIALEY